MVSMLVRFIQQNNVWFVFSIAFYYYLSIENCSILQNLSSKSCLTIFLAYNIGKLYVITHFLLITEWAYVDFYSMVGLCCWHIPIAISISCIPYLKAVVGNLWITECTGIYWNGYSFCLVCGAFSDNTSQSVE